MTHETIAAIRRELQQAADEKTKTGARRYFKEEVTVYGVKSALVGKIAAQHFPEVKPPGEKRRIYLMRRASQV